MTYFIGIDPGSPITMCLVSSKGSWVAYAGDEQLAFKDKRGWTNSPELFSHFIRKWEMQVNGNLAMVIENVGPMPGEGIISASKFAGSIWMARTAAVMGGIPYHMVTPQKWKKHFGLAKEKDLARQKALQLFPKRAARLKYKKDHNFAEAALIARYQWELENENRGGIRK